MVRSWLLVPLQTVYCKHATPVKRGILEKKASYLEHTMHVLDFSTGLQNAEVFVTFLKIYSSTDALLAILKVLGTNKGNTCGGISFWYSFR